MATYLDTQMCTLYINYREIPVMICWPVFTALLLSSLSSMINPLRTVVAYMRQGNKLDYHVQTNRYNFAALYTTNLKLLSFCSVYSAENSNVLGRM